VDRQQRQRPADHGSDEHDGELGGIAGQQVREGLGDVVVDAAPLLHGGDDGGEVIVSDDQVGGFLGDLGAGETHGDTDRGLAQRRGVVDTVARHGDDRAARRPGAHDA
jgi:hypothetical protein